MGMADSDLDCLREFGKKVQSTSVKKDDVKKKNVFDIDLNFVKKGIIRIRKHFIFRSHQLTYKLKNLYYSRNLFVGPLHKKLRDFISSSSKNELKNNSRFNDNNSSHMLVEYQKQLMNTSIIIRRRKRKVIDSSEKSLIPTPPSKAIAYYFHRIDSQENESKTNFSPRSSLWDFKYHSSHSFIIRLKNLFYKN